MGKAPKIVVPLFPHHQTPNALSYFSFSPKTKSPKPKDLDLLGLLFLYQKDIGTRVVHYAIA